MVGRYFNMNPLGGHAAAAAAAAAFSSPTLYFGDHKSLR
jgi:hypothetical protein